MLCTFAFVLSTMVMAVENSPIDPGQQVSVAQQAQVDLGPVREVRFQTDGAVHALFTVAQI